MKHQKHGVCHCINLRRATNRVTSLYDKALLPAGISTSQFSMLAHIERLQPVSVSALAADLELERTTVIRTLKSLLASGWVIDSAAGSAQRSRALSLTPAGIAVINKARPLWVAAQEAIEQRLGPSGIEQLEKLLDQLTFE